MTTTSEQKTDLIFAERCLTSLPEFDELEKRFPHLSWIDDYQTFSFGDVRQEKRCTVFARKRGPWLKPFHCYENSHYRFFSLDVAEGCAFDCVYCYLQSYLNHGALVLFLDFERLKEEILSLPTANVWLSSGLLTDSLLAENFFSVTSRISNILPSGAILELRTKSANVDVMKDPTIDRSRVVLSWSLNPQTIAVQYEYGTAGLKERLEAAHRAISMGYRVAFHLDPVFYYDGWKQGYEELLKEIAQFRYKDLAFLSLGLFRFMPELGNVIRKRFPFHSILTSEFFPDADGKYHYFRSIRKEMYRGFSDWLAPWIDHSVPVFRSMEPDARLR